MSLTWPNRHLTLADWAQLPEAEGARVELVEGLVVMTPMPLSWHQRAAMRLGYRLDEQLPPELTSLSGLEIVVSDPPPTIRIPDVVVTSSEIIEHNPPRIGAPDVQLAVEVLSHGTRRVDRILKFSEYADAGIPLYWIVDLGDPTTLHAYTLVDGGYEPSGEYSGQVRLAVAGHPVVVDLDALTRR